MSHEKISDLNTIRMKLQFMIPALPSSEKAAAVYLMEHLAQIGDMNLNMIAGKASLSSSTFIRFCKRMGYSGYQEFRNEVHEAQLLFQPDMEDKSAVLPMKQQMKEIIDKNIETMKRTLALASNQYNEVVEALQNANVIIMFGNGDAILPCEFIKIKLMKIGKTCITYSDQDLQVFSASTIHQGDVALAVSHTGRSKSVVEAMRIAQERGAITIGITASAKAPLLNYCRYVLYTGTVDETVSGDIISRRIAEQTILETLYMSVLNRCTSDIAILKRKGAENINKMTKIFEENPHDLTGKD